MSCFYPVSDFELFLNLPSPLPPLLPEEIDSSASTSSQAYHGATEPTQLTRSVNIEIKIVNKELTLQTSTS